MAREEGLELIDICTPTYLHYEQVKEALEWCSVICEKPLAFTAREAKDLFETAKRRGHHLYVAQVLRFFPEYQVLRKRVLDGSCGRMLDGSFWRLSVRPAWTSGGWMMDRKKSGLVPYDLHIHDLDFAVSLFGMPRSRQFTAARSRDDTMDQQYRFYYEFLDQGRPVHLCAEASGTGEIIPGLQAIGSALRGRCWRQKTGRYGCTGRDRNRKSRISARSV